MTELPRRRLLIALACWPMAARTQPHELSNVLPGARLQGQGRMRFFGLSVYDARLWVREGFEPDQYASLPLALELEYARSLVGQQIAERSLVEMKKVGPVPDDKAGPWLAAMAKTFPDVAQGDRITGLYLPGEAMRFYLNGKLRGEIRDSDFARLFVGIWLSAKTSEPKLRQALLGESR